MSLRASGRRCGFLWLVLIPGWSRAQSIIDGAKKEGRVVFYASMEAQSAQRLVAQFEKKYPFIKSMRRASAPSEWPPVSSLKRKDARCRRTS